MVHKILVAAPTFEGMRYCQDKFIQAVKNLDYPSYDILIVDNSKSEDYFNELIKISGIKVLRDNSSQQKSVYRLISSRNLIIDFGIRNNYTHILFVRFFNVMGNPLHFLVS